MTPFAKLFSQLAKRPETKEKLVSYEYSQRVVSLLLEKTNQNFQMVEFRPFDSYFGTDSADKDKEGENCCSALC
jgi:hypothetical protein